MGGLSRGLGLLCLLLAGLLAALLWSGREPPPAMLPDAASGPFEAAGVLGPAPPPPPAPETLMQITARPLFEPDRRPRPAAETAEDWGEDWGEEWDDREETPVTAGPGAPNWRLLGILRSAEGDRALFLDLQDGGRLLLHPGDEQDGWRVTGLTDRSVALTHPELGEATYRLERR